MGLVLILLDNTQHLQQTDIHATGGIQTRNLSRRAAADVRLRPRDRWNWSLWNIPGEKFCMKFELCCQCIREETGAQNTVKEIKGYQEKWLQHVQRMDTNRLGFSWFLRFFLVSSGFSRFPCV